jgi:hypothetical protein
LSGGGGGGGGGGNPSDYMDILWSPVVGSVKDGGAVDCRDKYYLRALQIMKDHELEIAMKDMLAVSIEHKINLFVPEILLGKIPHVFWNVVYQAQPKAKPNEARLQLHEMLHKLMPGADWEYLRTSESGVVTQASGQAM